MSENKRDKFLFQMKHCYLLVLPLSLVRHPTCRTQETFRSCADIKIVPHPLLSGLGDFKQKPVKDDDDLSIDFEDIAMSDDSLADTERKEALLRRKKLILEKVLLKLKELILLSQESDKGDETEYGSYNTNYLDDMRAEASEQKIFAPSWDERDYSYNYGEDDGDVNPWWEKIISNRH